MSTSQTGTTNPVNNQRQWSSNLFKPLDMSAIPGYPRQMPPKYEKWLPKFTGIDAIGAEEHMSSFWAFFQLHPIADDAEDLVMKLFPLHFMMLQDVGISAYLMGVLKPWINLKKFSSKGGASKKTQTCYLPGYMGLPNVKMNQ
jgi:hypothetical protein